MLSESRPSLSDFLYCNGDDLLGPLSLVKYGFWILFMLYLLFTRFKIKVDIIVVAYLVFDMGDYYVILLFRGIPGIDVID